MITHPPTGFYFTVTLFDHDDKLKKQNAKRFGATYDAAFQSVAGLSNEMETEPYREGGENRFAYELPVKAKAANLILKRGLIVESTFVQWCQSTFRDMLIQPKNVHVELLNEAGDPLFTWHIFYAWPKKWSVADLNAERGEIVIETLELTYRYCTVSPGAYAPTKNFSR